MSTDLKLSNAQISKIIQSLLSKLAGPLVKVAVPLAKKYFIATRNYSSCFSNWCKNSE